MKNFIIGFLIGIGKILPGVSGSVIAIRFNVYERMIDSLINYFKNIKKNTKFLISIGLGIISSIVLTSSIILNIYTKYKSITILVFAILIISGIKDIYVKGNNYYITIIGFFISLLLIRLNINVNPSYFFMGIIESISVIIPGISGTAIYISFGVYDKMLNLFIHYNIYNLCNFFLGLLFCSIVLIKIIDYSFKMHKKETYSLILGFQLASIILLLSEVY